MLTYSQFLCAAVCSALTTSMVGVCKSVLQTVLGFFTFGGVQFHPLNAMGELTILFLTLLHIFFSLILRDTLFDKTKSQSVLSIRIRKKIIMKKLYVSMGFMAERISGRLEHSMSYTEAFQEESYGIFVIKKLNCFPLEIKEKKPGYDSESSVFDHIRHRKLCIFGNSHGFSEHN